MNIKYDHFKLIHFKNKNEISKEAFKQIFTTVNHWIMLYILLFRTLFADHASRGTNQNG